MRLLRSAECEKMAKLLDRDGKVWTTYLPAKVVQRGGKYQVALPEWFALDHDIKAGDEIAISSQDGGNHLIKMEVERPPELWWTAQSRDGRLIALGKTGRETYEKATCIQPSESQLVTGPYLIGELRKKKFANFEELRRKELTR